MKDSLQMSGVRFHDVVFDTESVALYSQQSKLLAVEKKNIRNIVLRYGFQSERPIAQVVFGLFVTVLGLYLVLDFLLIAQIHRIVYDVACLSPLLLPVGVWFTLDGLRKRLYFEVILDNDVRKFPLGKDPNEDQLRQFIKHASQLGYVIDAGILDE